MTNIDFLAIGDTVTDAFIKLKDAEVNCKLNNENCELCVRYGDKVPYESVEVCTAVGNSANAAVSAARLGLNSSLYSYVGGDQYNVKDVGSGNA
jgi:sugar/nucleoside kinase (ribokinase family)